MKKILIIILFIVSIGIFEYFTHILSNNVLAPIICKANGGFWGKIPIRPGGSCVHTYPDADKPCTKSTECSGDCIVESWTDTIGKCQSVTPDLGCNRNIEGITLCAD